jgi:hypothetical protein
VWQGSAGDRRPYADQVGFEEVEPLAGIQNSATLSQARLHLCSQSTHRLHLGIGIDRM